MFCDLVDSVALSTRLDPEDLRELIVAYQQTCAEAVAAYEGYVARYAGDGVLVYFGYPVAHENDAERGVRAGLELVSAVSRLGRERYSDLDLRVRIGIATGLVIVGHVEAQGISDRHAVVGEAANLAARLQDIAEPNAVVVSEVTRQLAGEMFEYRDLGRLRLKGFAAPIAAWQVVRQREVTRLQARSPALTPFVNREDEITVLLDCWRHATAGEGQVVVLVGQGGVGKSRLVVETTARIALLDPSGPAPVVLQYSPFHSNAPLYPVIRQLARLAGIAVEDPPSLKRDKLAGLLGCGSDHGERVSLVGDLLGIAPEPGGLPAGMGPVAKRHRTIAVLLDWFASLGRKGPATIVFEDVQWIDPTSRLLLGRLVERAKTDRLLIVLTLRTDNRADADRILREAGLTEPSGGTVDHVTVCELRELKASHGRQLALAAAESRGATVETSQLEVVLARSGGIPLYLEELVKAAASGVGFSLGKEGSAPDGDVPRTISGALMAQLDRLGLAKRVAQHAAVIGHEFSLSLLARIMERRLDELLPAVESLIDQRIVVRGSSSPDGYWFKHALIRDVSYRSLLRKDRRQIHLAVARELSRHPAETVAVSDDLIARHYARGGEPLEAVRLWQRAAGDAIARSANEEAIAMLDAALAELQRLDEVGRSELELDVVLTQAMALRSVRGYSAPEVEQRLVRARELCFVRGDFDDRFNVTWGLFQCSFVKGDVDGARAFAAELLSLAEDKPGPALVDANLANGMVAFDAGEFEAAMGFFGTGAGLCQPEHDQPRFLTHGQNAGLFCLSYLARAQGHRGYLDRARTTIQRARTIAAGRLQDPGHVHSYLNVAIHAVRVYHLCDDLEAERRLAHETVEMARHNHYAYYEALGRCHLGWVVGAKGNLSEGIAMLSDAVAALRQTGTLLAVPGFLLLLSQLYLHAGRREEAERVLVTAASTRGHTVWDADIERVRGDIASADSSAAEAAYRSGLVIARRQRAGLFVCKTGLSLARLLQAQGRYREARELLKECLSELPEGNDIVTVRQMRAMIA